MKKVLSLSLLVLLATPFVRAADGEEIIQLNVAFAGPNVQQLAQATSLLLQASNRKVTNVEITSTFGTGRPAGVAIHHVQAGPVEGPCTVEAQSFAVSFFTDFFGRANEVLGFLRMANKKMVDFKYLSFFGTGKPASGAFYYCK